MIPSRGGWVGKYLTHVWVYRLKILTLFRTKCFKSFRQRDKIHILGPKIHLFRLYTGT